MSRMNDSAPEVLMPAFVFRNCIVWGSAFAAVPVALIFGPAIWWKANADLLDVVRPFIVLAFVFDTMLQAFYFGGRAKFLEKMPSKGPRKQEQGNGNGGV